MTRQSGPVSVGQRPSGPLEELLLGSLVDGGTVHTSSCTWPAMDGPLCDRHREVALDIAAAMSRRADVCDGGEG